MSSLDSNPAKYVAWDGEVRWHDLVHPENGNILHPKSRLWKRWLGLENECRADVLTSEHDNTEGKIAHAPPNGVMMIRMNGVGNTGDMIDPCESEAQTFASLGHEQVTRVSTYGTEVQVPDGTLVLKRGRRSVDFLRVLKGATEIFDTDKHGATSSPCSQYEVEGRSGLVPALVLCLSVCGSLARWQCRSARDPPGIVAFRRTSIDVHRSRAKLCNSSVLL